MNEGRSTTLSHIVKSSQSSGSGAYSLYAVQRHRSFGGFVGFIESYFEFIIPVLFSLSKRPW